MSSFLLFYRPLFGGLLPLTAGLLLLFVSELLLSSVLLGIAATYSKVLRPLEAVVFLAGGTAAIRGAAVLLAALLLLFTGLLMRLLRVKRLPPGAVKLRKGLVKPDQRRVW